MFAELVRAPDATETSMPVVPTTYALAVLLGGGIGFLFSWLWPHLTGLAGVALWPLGFALGALGAGVGTMFRSGETAWGLVFGGQVLGAVALALLLLAL